MVDYGALIPRWHELTAVFAAPGSPEWHAERRRRVGCSEVGCLMGLWDWPGADTPADLAREKAGGDVKAPSWAMVQGNAMEAAIVDWYCAAHGCEAVLLPTLYETARPWHGGNFDRLLVYPDGRVMLTEVKWSRSKWKEIPTRHYAQMQRELQLAGFGEGLLLHASPWTEPDGPVIEANPDIQADIEAAVEAFSEEWGLK